MKIIQYIHTSSLGYKLLTAKLFMVMQNKKFILKFSAKI